MEPSHTSPSVFTAGQSFQPHAQAQPQVQEQSSPSVGSEHADSGGRPQTQSPTGKPLLGSSEGHSPPRDRNEPHPEFEPVTPQAPVPARSRDGHMMVRGLSRRTAMGHVPNSGIDWIVPIDDKPHVRVACTFVAAFDPEPDLTATYNRRAATTKY
jgi:hypothetical protein